MKYGLLFKKTSTCYKNPDIEYLDETSDYKLKILIKQGKITKEEFEQKHQELQRSISYLTKEKHGRVYAGGFIRDMLLSKKAMAPEKWDNQIRKKAITSAVYKTSRTHGTYRGALGHKMVFSVSGELSRKLENFGLNLDEVLGREVKKIMYEFQRKFHPGEKIGFAWGIHHDSKHRHVHVYLCNRTDQGNHIALSNPLKGRVQNRHRKNQIGYMKERCEAAVIRMEKQIEKSSSFKSPGQVKYLKVEHQKPKYIISPEMIKRQEKLDEMQRSLLSKENHLKLQQSAIRQHSSEYYLRKEFIARKWDDVREINKSISEDYQKLKHNDHIISPKLLRQLGWVSDSGAIKFFSKMLYLLHNEQNRARRQAVLDQINKSKQYKNDLINQLKMLDDEKRNYLSKMRQMKAERENIRQDFYQALNQYQWEKEKFNDEILELKSSPSRQIEKEEKNQQAEEEIPTTIDWQDFRNNFTLFKESVKDKEKLERYRQARQKLLDKNEHGEDYQEELRILWQLDQEAKGLSPQIIEKEEEAEYLKMVPRIIKNKNESQDKGIEF